MELDMTISTYNTLINQKGVVIELALFLIAKLKELSKVERKQLSSICGLAPIPNDSGKIKGHRYINGGRREIKGRLYLSFIYNNKTQIEVCLLTVAFNAPLLWSISQLSLTLSLRSWSFLMSEASLETPRPQSR
jgi:hypothetical protein